MRKTMSREEILARLKKTVRDGRPILVACCGTGLYAKCAELGGADIIMTACTSKSRLMGLPTTPLGGNDDILRLIPELLNVVHDIPIIASLDATDPTRMDLAGLIEQAAHAGYSGVLNYPTLSPLFGHFRRAARESVGLGFEREVEMMHLAKANDLFSIAYVFNTEDARAMAEAHVDCLVAHMGSTRGGIAGFGTVPMKEAAMLAQNIIDVARAIDPNIIFLAHGGPFATPEDTEYLYEHTDAVGFVGASSIERIPVERAIREAVSGFKAVSLGNDRKIKSDKRRLES